MLFFLFLILLGVGYFKFIQYQNHQKANKLYRQAKELEQKDTKNPYNVTRFNQAIRFYKQCSQLINDPKFVKAIKQCQIKIDDRHKFQDLLTNSRNKASQGYHKEALMNLTKARKLFDIPKLQKEIQRCQNYIQLQENYESGLKQSIQIAKQGRFQEAIDLFEPILDEFSREDGQQFLSELQRIISAKELYKLGLSVEKKNNFNDAIYKYKQALSLLPELTKCNVRLAILSVKENPKQTISYLEKLDSPQASYIRGFAYTQLGDWQQANREWKSINHDEMDYQREILRSLAERDRLSQIKEIEVAVDNNNFDMARTLSLEFIHKFGSEPTTEQNLENHIQPRLERQIWEDQNWQQIVLTTERIWLEQQDINSLHNWAIATYYQTQIDSSKLVNFIIAWSTALANIERNPKLQNIPWLGSNSTDIKDVSTKLKQILENAIDTVKDEDIEKYLKLRDLYRREIMALSLIQQKNCGVKIKKQFFILPGYYQRFRDYYLKVKSSPKVCGALYTDWGKAVAACYEGDIARAIKIKPNINPVTEADYFADCFVSYYEGCHYLQNLEWYKAVKSLQNAQLEIQVNSEWCMEIDHLCEAQRKNINDFEEHLQFSKFWYELLDSQLSRSYFAEYKARKAAEQLSNENITTQQGLKQLKDIQDIDRNNPVVLELVKTLETVQESERIDYLIQQGKFEEAVRAAKRSSNEDIRFRLAEFCLEVIFKQIQSGNLSYETLQGLNQIAGWAYELCPYEPAFQPVYRQLRVLGIRC